MTPQPESPNADLDRLDALLEAYKRRELLAYASARDTVYAQDSMFLAHEVREWAIRNGDNPLLRIALCGYEGEHEMPASWACVAWKANGGYGNQSGSTRGRENATKERIWLSPHCLPAASEVAA